MFGQSIFGGGGGSQQQHPAANVQSPTAVSNADDLTPKVAFGQTPVFGGTVFGSPPLAATGSIFGGGSTPGPPPPPYRGSDQTLPPPPYSQGATRTTASSTGWGFAAAATNPPAFVFGAAPSASTSTAPIFPGAAFRDTPSTNLFGDRFGSLSKDGASIFGSQSTAPPLHLPPTTFSFVQPSASSSSVVSPSTRDVLKPSSQSSFDRVQAVIESRLQRMEDAERHHPSGDHESHPSSVVATHGQERGPVPSAISASGSRVRSAVAVADRRGQQQQSRVTGLFGRAVRGALPGVPNASSLNKYERPRDPRSRRVSERDESGQSVTRLPPEQIEQLTSIVCKGIPPSLNNRPTLLRHFGRFGVVRKVVCNVSKDSATVHFNNHAGAVVAKASGTILQPGTQPMLILWSRVLPSARTKSTGEDGSVSSSSGGPSSSTSRSRAVESSGGDDAGDGSRLITNTGVSTRSPSRKIYVADSEVGDELSAMIQEPAQALERPPKHTSQAQAVDAASTKVKTGKGKSAKRPDVTSSSEVLDALPAILSISAQTSNERYRVLEARDKLLRIGIRKQSNIATAKATVGTCPDMCPEKERYLREDRKQLHPFELRDSGDAVDHRRAIKEYSRSSADQEEPLPSELRPPQVLSLTMDYLICNIMNRHQTGLSTAEEWFDFLWNRTRAIRKDITQQHLCDASSVRLLEQCARFHLHAASRLCEEDMIAFDQKINNENLTNCLQTLKHFYEDVAKEADCDNHFRICPQEAEFRAYDVLLNLNEGGDTLRQAQQFPPHIRAAPELSEALEVLAAVNANNYVRFFRLVRGTTYLNACLLQRYFGQVRQKALVAIMRSYCPSTRAGLFPANKLVDLLAFEDLDDARIFVESHGLAIENGHVVLDRSQFYHPEAALPLRRAHRIIESKLACSVGQVIYGGPLPVNPLERYQPQNSFDSNGRLTDRDPRDNTAARSTMTSRDISTSFVQQQPQRQHVMVASSVSSVAPPASPGEMFLLQGLPDVLNAVSEEILNEVTAEKARVVSCNAIDRVKRISMEIATVVLGETCNEMIRQSIDQTVRLAKAAELMVRREREQQELERRQQHDRHVSKIKETYADLLLETLLDDVVLDLSMGLAVQEIREELAVAKLKCVERCSRVVAEELCESCIDQLVASVCWTLHSQQTEFKKRVLSRVSANLDLWRAAVFIRKWRRVVAKRVASRCSMEGFPASSLCRLPGTLEQRFKGKSRLASPLEAADNRSRVADLLDLSERSSQLRAHLGGHAFIDLVQIARDHVPHARRLGRTLPAGQRNLYWKLLVHATSGECGDGSHRLLEWLQFKLEPRLPAYESTITAEVMCEDFCLVIGDSASSRQHTFDTSVCVRAVVGGAQRHTISGAASPFMGAQGVLFLICLPGRHGFEDPMCLQRFWENESVHLLDLLNGKPASPSLPLAIVVMVSGNEPEESDDSRYSADIRCQLRLNYLQEAGLVSEVSVTVLGAGLREPEATTALLHATRWLARRCPRPPSLLSQDLQSVAADVLARYFSPLVYRDLALCNVVDIQHQPPNVLIDEYNYCIEYVTELVLNAPNDISWPSPEFVEKATDLPPLSWSQDRAKSAAALRSLRLPRFDDDEDVAEGDWTDMSRSAWKYAMALDDHDWRVKVVLASRIRKLIDPAPSLEEAGSRVSATGRAFPWTDLVLAFLDYLCPTCETGVNITYLLNAEQPFEASARWKRTTDARRINRTPTSAASREDDDDPKTSSKRRKSSTFGTATKKRPPIEDPFGPPSKVDDLRLSHCELLRQVNVEKQRSHDFEASLKSALAEGTVDVAALHSAS